MSTGKLHFGRIIVFAGALLAYFIGAGFATGQEVLQFYTSWGYELFIVVAVAMAMLVWAAVSYAVAGSKYQFHNNAEVFTYYCGKWGGLFFDIFSVVFCFACYIYMCAGAGSTLNQQFGLPTIVGAVLMGALVILSVTLGLQKITEILGRLGTVIIVVVLFVALYNLFMNFGDLGANLTAIGEDYTQFGLTRTIAPNAFVAGGSYIGATIIWTTAFVAMMAAGTEHKKEVKVGMVVGCIFIALGLILSALAMAANVEQVGASAVPNLLMAGNVWAPLGSIYAVIVILGIYTSAVPLLWTSVSRFAKEGDKKFTLLSLALGIIGLVIALFVPYQTLVNYILTIGGYVVYVFWIALVVGDVITMVTKKDPRVKWLPENVGVLEEKND